MDSRLVFSIDSTAVIPAEQALEALEKRASSVEIAVKSMVDSYSKSLKQAGSALSSLGLNSSSFNINVDSTGIKTATVAQQALKKAMDDGRMSADSLFPALSKLNNGFAKLEAEVNKNTAIVDKFAARTSTVEGINENYRQSLERVRIAYINSNASIHQLAAAEANLAAQRDRQISYLTTTNTLMGNTAAVARLTREQMVNLGYQLNDIFVGLASGQKPLTVFIQQGAQIAGIASASGVGLKGMAIAALEMAANVAKAGLAIAVANPVLTVAAASVVALTLEYQHLSSELSKDITSTGQSKFVAMGGTVDDFKSKLDALGGSTITLKERFNALNKITGLDKTYNVIGQISSEMGTLTKESAQSVAGMSAFASSFVTHMLTFSSAWNPFKQAFQDGKNSIKELQDQWDALKKDMETPLQIRVRIALAEQQIENIKQAQSDIKSLQRTLLSPLEQIRATAADSLATIEKAKVADAGYDPQTYADLKSRILAKEKKDTDDYYADLAKKRKKDLEEAKRYAEKKAAAEANANSIIAQYSYGTAVNTVKADVKKKEDKLGEDYSSGLITKQQYDKAVKYLDQYASIEAPRAAKKAQIAFAAANDPLYTFNQSIRNQTAGIDLLGDAYDDYIQIYQKYEEYRKEGITLSGQQKQKIQDDVISTNNQIRVHQALNSIYAQGQGAIEQQVIVQAALDKMLKDDPKSIKQYNQAMYDSSIAVEQAKANMAGYGQTFADTTKKSMILKQAIDDLNNAIMAGKDKGGLLASQAQSKTNEKSFIDAGASDVYSDTQGQLDKLTESQNQYKNAVKAGLITQGYYAQKMRESTAQAAKLQLQLGKGTWKDSFDYSMSGLTDGFTNGLDEMSSAFHDFNNQLIDGFSKSLGDAVVKGDSLRESFQSLSETILSDLVSSLIEAGLKMVLLKALGEQVTWSQVLGIQTVSATKSVASQKEISENVAGTAPALTRAGAEAGATFGTSALVGAAAFGALMTLIIASSSKFADGGYVTGPGSGRSDSINARLSNGEFVMNADATAKNRQILETMNNGGILQQKAINGGTMLAQNNTNNTTNFSHSTIIQVSGSADTKTIAMIAQASEQSVKKAYAVMLDDFANNKAGAKLIRNKVMGVR